MGEMAVEGQGSEGQEIEDTSVAEGSEGGSGINPAWNEMLEVLPSSLHSLVTPHLQKWDQNYQSGIQKVHSQYEAYKEYLDNQIAPDQINYGLNLMRAIEERPGEVMAALQQAMGIQDPPKVEEPNPDEQGQFDANTDFLNHPKLQNMEQMVNTIAQILVQQGQSQQEAAEDEALSNELDQMHEKHGDFDEEWVLTKMLANPNIPIEKHVEAYKQFVTGIIQQQRQPGPKVMGAGGGAPNNQIVPGQLDDKGRRSLVAQMLEAAHQQQ